MKKVWIVAILIAAVFIAGCGKNTTVPAAQSPLTVKVLDIGQGDAILIRSDGIVTLVDTGDVPAREQLVRLLKEQGIKELDNVIITHPHADHLGGMAAVLENFTVKHIYDSGQTTTSAIYRNYLAAVKKKNIPFTVVSAGNDIPIGSGVLKVFGPQTTHLTGTDSDLNNNSIVVKLQYGSFAMLLPGDAEKQEEEQLLRKYGSQLASNILKSGHHGSNTASSPEFLKAVNPQAVMISVGANNEYHHPHPSILKRYQGMNLKVYRTDYNGTITITSDGQNYNITKEKE